MSGILSATGSFKPMVEGLEDRLVLSVSVKALLSTVFIPLQQATQRIVQLQVKLPGDIQTMKTDAGTFTFFTESMATQTKVDQDYAKIGSEVGQIHALVAQIHNEASLATALFRQAGRGESRKVRRVLIPQALGLVDQFVKQADQIDAALVSGPAVAQSPIKGQPLEPQYPALNTIPSFLA
jgi:hypothetical protein